MSIISGSIIRFKYIVEKIAYYVHFIKFPLNGLSISIQFSKLHQNKSMDVSAMQSKQ